MPRLKQLKPLLKAAGDRLKQAQPTAQRHVSRGTWDVTRERILTRDQGLCQCTKCKAAGRIRPAQQVDHITPLWEGGADDDTNLQSINVECHKLKTQAEQRRRQG